MAPPLTVRIDWRVKSWFQPIKWSSACDLSLSEKMNLVFELEHAIAWIIAHGLIKQSWEIKLS